MLDGWRDANIAFDGWREAWISRLTAAQCFDFAPDGGKATADGFGLRRRGCGRNDEKDYSSKIIRMIRFALLLLRLLASFHSEKRSLAHAVGGEIPAKILSLLLPPNNCVARVL